MPLTLAMDTSADVCAAAFIRDGVCLGAGRREMTRGHAEALVPMIQDIAATAGVALPDVDIVGVAKGPGSFTGLRTGIAAARGFALASGAQAVGVSSLDAVARRRADRQAGRDDTPNDTVCSGDAPVRLFRPAFRRRGRSPNAACGSGCSGRVRADRGWKAGPGR